MYTGESPMLINYSSTFLTEFLSLVVQVKNQNQNLYNSSMPGATLVSP